MRKQILLMSMLALSSIGMSASEVNPSDTVVKVHPNIDRSLIMPLKPTYIPNAFVGNGWDSNWFVELKGGATAFMGSPVGCGDIYDRITPNFQVGIGKWFTPSVGGRVEFQGLEFKNANLQNTNYQFVHADFMYNVAGGFCQNEKGIARWDFVPFVGVGMIRNSDWKNCCQCAGVMSNRHPFAFSYGIQVGYRLANHLHLIAEISGMTTARNFDGAGASSKFGDSMLNISAGLSVTLGKTGWKRVVDARPYINQNNYLIDQCAMLRKQLNEMSTKSDDTDGLSRFNKNDYHGLVSLRMRLSKNESDNYEFGDEKNDETYSHDEIEIKDSIKSLINIPVYFYFNLGTAILVDPSQLSNLDELAQIARLQNLKVTVKGAADSATGSMAINETLSGQRARFISNELKKRGVPEERIQTSSLGGIDNLSPKEANRHSCVILSF